MKFLVLLLVFLTCASESAFANLDGYQKINDDKKENYINAIDAALKNSPNGSDKILGKACGGAIRWMQDKDVTIYINSNAKQPLLAAQQIVIYDENKKAYGTLYFTTSTDYLQILTAQYESRSVTQESIMVNEGTLADPKIVIKVVERVKSKIIDCDKN